MVGLGEPQLDLHDGLESNSSRIISLYILLKFYRTSAAPFIFIFSEHFCLIWLAGNLLLAFQASPVYFHAFISTNQAAQTLPALLSWWCWEHRAIPNPWASQILPQSQSQPSGWSSSAGLDSGSAPWVPKIPVEYFPQEQMGKSKAQWEHPGSPFREKRGIKRFCGPVPDFPSSCCGCWTLWPSFHPLRRNSQYNTKIPEPFVVSPGSSWALTAFGGVTRLLSTQIRFFSPTFPIFFASFLIFWCSPFPSFRSSQQQNKRREEGEKGKGRGEILPKILIFFKKSQLGHFTPNTVKSGWEERKRERERKKKNQVTLNQVSHL